MHRTLLPWVCLSLAIVSACKAPISGTGTVVERRTPHTSNVHTSAAAAMPHISALLQPLTPFVLTDANQAKVLLGRDLYHDTRLSGDGTLSCASCHNIADGGAQHSRTSTGIRGQIGPINAPTVLNSGFNFVQFWDGRAPTLEEQATGPVANPMEMGAEWQTVIQNLQRDAALVARFNTVFGSGVTQDNVVSAIADYERSLVTPSRYDQYLRGDHNALNAEEIRGLEFFQSVGCTDCHQGPILGGTMFQKMGRVRDYFGAPGHGALTDADYGHFNVTHNETDRHMFKVPTLRNVAQTAPYLHDGSQATLTDVVGVMGRHQIGREFSPAETQSLVAFLNALTGELPAHAVPQ